MDVKDVRTFADAIAFAKDAEQRAREFSRAAYEYQRANPQLPPDTIVDETQSVLWNRQEIAKRNKLAKATCTRLKKRASDVYCEIDEAIINAIVSEYSFSAEVSRKIYRRAYDEMHAYGFSDVISKADDLADFVSDILDYVS